MDSDGEHPKQNKIYVWLIDDDTTYRRYVRTAFSYEQDKFDYLEFSSSESALLYLERCSPPDIILLDISLPGGMSGLEALLKFREQIPQTHVIMVTVNEQDEYVYEAIHRGAEGYVVKSSQLNETISAIQDVLQGKRRIILPVTYHFSPLVERVKTFISSYQLTSCEYKLIAMIKEGAKRKSLPQKLFVSEHTVKFHLKSLFNKTGVHTYAELVQKIFSEL